MRVAFGMVQPDAGTIVVDGVERRFASPADAISAGVGMVHQHFTLVPAMTASENVALGGRGRYDPRAAVRRVEQIGAETGLALDPHALAGSLPVGAQQRLEIAKALSRDARLLILDEPTAVLAPAEARELLRWLRGLAERGRSVVLITHRLRDALSFADDVTVLRRGGTVAALPSVDADEGMLAELMLGEPAAAESRRESGVAPGEPVLRARGLVVADERGVERVRDATLDVRAGEIVGLAGVEGAGQHELLRALAGRLRPTRGSVDAPRTVGFIPEDRHRDALLLDGSLTENAALRGSGARRGLVGWRAMAERAGRLVAAADVRAGAAGPEAVARALSGGNQQKFVAARELDAAGGPLAVIAENPTRGLDIRAGAAVRARLRAARDDGAAVLVYSSDLDEVLALADRVLVIHQGHVSAVPADRDAVGRAMLGVV
jgi:simple sugar transport system ATP-binding protein